MVATATHTAVPTATLPPVTTTPTVTETETTVTATSEASTTATLVPTALTPLPTPTLTVLDETRRAKLFDDVWSVVDEHYLYEDFGGVDWEKIKLKYRPQVLAADTPDAFYETLEAMIDELRDEHSRFESPQEAFVQEALASGTEAYVGIGILSVMTDDGMLITTVFPNSPAAEANIKRRDVIVAVDGVPVNDETSISGRDDTEVQLHVRSPDDGTRIVTLRRQPVLAQYVPELYLLPETHIGYLLIQSFWAHDMAEKVRIALSEFVSANEGQIDGLIIDVRGNGGGWRNVLEGVLQHFVSGEVGAFYSQRTNYPLSITSSELYEPLKDVPIVVLVDRETESYAEIFAAVLQSARGAEVVGVSTAGNTETIFAYDFEDKSRLWVAQEGFKLPDGSNLEGRGVVPDRSISIDWTQFSERRDPHIVKAVELIQQQAAGQH